MYCISMTILFITYPEEVTIATAECYSKCITIRWIADKKNINIVIIYHFIDLQITNMPEKTTTLK